MMMIVLYSIGTKVKSYILAKNRRAWTNQLLIYVYKRRCGMKINCAIYPEGIR